MCVGERERDRESWKERSGAEMDAEIKNFIKVWIGAVICLCYCYYIASRIPKGILRLISLLPVIYLFIILPWDLTSFHLAGPTVFFLVWLGNFKLLLFSFDQGPLSPPPPSLFHFISISCLPLKIKQGPPNPSTNAKSAKNLPVHQISRSVLLAVKVVLLAVIFHSYSSKQHMHPNVVLALYCVHMYLELEILLAICATPARALFGFDLEPQFNEPYLSTSLQDFWGHRWNLMVTSILRPTVHNPARRIFSSLIGPKWASTPAIVATFVVSGLMHEVVYYYLARASPTWEVTWFFILHGLCVAAEAAVKKVVGDKWRLHRLVSGPLTIGFLAVTGAWLFFPQLTRNGVDEKAIGEYFMSFEFLKAKSSTLLSFP